MGKLTKNQKAAIAKYDAAKEYKLAEACELVKEIAQTKMADMNCFTLKSAMTMVAGTARSMGIKVEGEFPEL